MIKYFNSEGAHGVWTESAGSLVTLLDAILPLMGWVIAFSAGHRRAYRSDHTLPGASGCYFYIDNTLAEYATYRVYKSMSDIDTGEEPVPRVADLPDGHVMARCGDGWQIIGDSRTIYFNSVDETGMRVSFLGVGDYISGVPGNTYNYMSIGSIAMGVGYEAILWANSSSNTRFSARNLNLDPDTATDIHLLPSGSLTSGTTSWESANSSVYGITAAPAMLSTNNQHYGKFRGMFFAMCNLSADPETYQEYSIDGFDLLVKRFTNGYYSLICVLLSQDEGHW